MIRDHWGLESVEQVPISRKSSARSALSTEYSEECPVNLVCGSWMKFTRKVPQSPPELLTNWVSIAGLT
jgi:hypothetical protein